MNWSCERIPGYNNDTWLRFTRLGVKKDILEDDFYDMMTAYSEINGTSGFELLIEEYEERRIIEERKRGKKDVQ